MQGGTEGKPSAVLLSSSVYAGPPERRQLSMVGEDGRW